MIFAVLLALSLSRFFAFSPSLLLSLSLLVSTSGRYCSVFLLSPIFGTRNLAQPFPHVHITKPNEQRTVAITVGLSPTPQGPMAPTLYYTRDTPAFAGFKPEPAGRGTKGIIWTCLSTILLSSWSSFHGPAYDPNESFKSEARDSYIVRFGAAFLLPELVAVRSLRTLYNALQLRKTIRQVGGPEFANFSLTQAFLFINKSVYQRLPNSEKMELVDGKTLVQLMSSRHLPISGLPTDNEIADKSKRDWTLKSLSIIQTLWFIVSVVARLSRGYPVSLFEDITVANAICGVIEFACWFHCPQDIRLPFIVKPDIPRAANGPSTAAEREEPEEEATVEALLLVSEDATKYEASSGPQLSVLVDISTDRPNKEFPSSEQPPLTQKTMKRRVSFATQPAEFRAASNSLFSSILAVFSVLFAGIHMAVWNYSFLSVAEAWIWRGSSLALIVLGLCISLISNQIDERSELETAWDWIFLINTFLYPLARTMMLGVALASFRKVPARLYETPSWTQYWPHI
ncbi:hypothetical protein B0H65DRAFT_325185 [Neurospora tetraspora]|uniref:Uncharacterized protein n=1 Tax=Neurospora tetraspora TaxID=94610 RepID=A0AAE0J7W7_9PEZI|nr:hypothetical protein B0H65DRAFT_325185 [Neurospora tetraspora]